jgi:hypothetical protein
MKSEAEYRAGQELATAAAIADACHPNRVAVDPQMGQLHAEIAIGHAIIALIEELRESRRPVLVKCQCGGVGGHPKETHVVVM